MSRGGTRSLSAPPAPSAREILPSDTDVSEFPVVAVETDHFTGPATWMRDLSATRSGRQSRASSIISTRTRFSTTTIDEVRSIDVRAGGQTFRISRDGSKITDTTAPPPYPGSWNENWSDHITTTQHVSSLPNDHDEDGLPLSLAEREPRKRVRILMPDEEETSSATNEPSPERSPDRVLTQGDLYQIMRDLPLQLKKVLGIRSPKQTSEPRMASGFGLSHGSNSEPHLPSQPDRDHVEPPTPHEQPSSFSRFTSLRRRSSGPSASPIVPISSSYGLAGLQPRDSPDERTDFEDYLEMSQASKASSDTIRAPQHELDDSHALMTVGDLNELSSLYNSVIRDLDREHRRKLHERDKEMAQLRSLLNEKDIVYRQQLRGKDFIIEDQRKQLAHQEDLMELKLEKARNQVEDLWEKRWKDRDRHLMERMRRMEGLMVDKEPQEETDEGDVEDNDRT